MTAPLIALSMGDPAGIGPEIIAQALRLRPEWSRHCVVFGDVACLRRAAEVTGGLQPIAVLERPADALGVPAGCIPVCQVEGGVGVPAWGRVSAAAGRWAALAIERGARAALSGEVAALVTAPIHKEALAAAGIAHPGHTEYLQQLAADHLGVPVLQLPVRMMLSSPQLNTVLVSIHVSLRDAIERVTVVNVLETVRIAHRHWTEVRQTPRCRIAVAGLNPHAGEGGLFGREEVDIIAPAVALARQEGIDVQGPFAPDTVYMKAREGAFDVVIAMYHDQGLIPVKYLGLAHGVNTTLGLPFVRTSPDHGTAFDMAGTGRADPSSLMAAIEAAQASVQ